MDRKCRKCIIDSARISAVRQFPGHGDSLPLKEVTCLGSVRMRTLMGRDGRVHYGWRMMYYWFFDNHVRVWLHYSKNKNRNENYYAPDHDSTHARDNIIVWKEFWYESCHRWRIDRLTCSAVQCATTNTVPRVLSPYLQFLRSHNKTKIGNRGIVHILKTSGGHYNSNEYIVGWEAKVLDYLSFAYTIRSFCLTANDVCVSRHYGQWKYSARFITFLITHHRHIFSSALLPHGAYNGWISWNI